jgi:hypothetical protein
MSAITERSIKISFSGFSLFQILTNNFIVSTDIKKEELNAGYCRRMTFAFNGLLSNKKQGADNSKYAVIKPLKALLLR